MRLKQVGHKAQPFFTFESRVTLVKVQAEANASACFFINSVYVKNPSCFPMKTERVVVAETGLEPAASGL